jgi:hypothetical protein
VGEFLGYRSEVQDVAPAYKAFGPLFFEVPASAAAGQQIGGSWNDYGTQTFWAGKGSDEFNAAA